MHARRTRSMLSSVSIVATWLLSIAVAGLFAVGAASAAPPDTPPDGWVFSPKELPPGFSGMECTFGFAANVYPTFLPSAACEEKEWLNSGIFREQARDLYVNPSPPMAMCGGGPAELDIIRMCSHGWINVVTPWGPAGDNGCAVPQHTWTCL